MVSNSQKMTKKQQKKVSKIGAALPVAKRNWKLIHKRVGHWGGSAGAQNMPIYGNRGNCLPVACLPPPSLFVRLSSIQMTQVSM